MPVELPTGTLKRLSLPLFSMSRYGSTWGFRLFDDHGRLRAERSGLEPRSSLPAGATLLGALPRTSAPVIRQILNPSPDSQPAVARFVQSAILPDNPLVWEAMKAFYLNSEKAPELTVSQVEALRDWLNDGGHLIVAVAAVSDVNATPWLRALVPFDLAGERQVTQHPGLQQWVRSPRTTPVNSLPPPSRPLPSNVVPSAAGNPFAGLADDSEFENAPLSVATGTLRRGETLVSAGDTPLIVTARQGRGRVTALLFDPESEPCHSWKNLPTFWAKLAVSRSNCILPPVPATAAAATALTASSAR